MKALPLFASVLLSAACSSNKPAQSPTDTAAADGTDSQSTVTETSSTRVEPDRADTTPQQGDVPQRSARQSSDTNDDERRSVRGPEIADTTSTTSPPRTTSDVAGDDSANNSRDRNGGTLLPTDQGESKPDLQITQEIRQALMKEPSLSFTAKNVKIITEKGRVTLRGAVKNDGERSLVVSDAERIAGTGNVDNQLDLAK
ncbi:MAG TPA: BON domain-containing protein [Polyangiaceae bacterium]|nr:BON domain-containing protein [Polyangiaceae bacterium]